jgi:hypothetical protein
MSVREQLPEDGLDIGGGRRVWESVLSKSFCISWNGHWRPGCFATFEAAEQAFKVNPNKLCYREFCVGSLTYKFGHSTPITLSDIEHFLSTP